MIMFNSHNHSFPDTALPIGKDLKPKDLPFLKIKYRVWKELPTSHCPSNHQEPTGVRIYWLLRCWRVTGGQVTLPVLQEPAVVSGRQTPKKPVPAHRQQRYSRAGGTVLWAERGKRLCRNRQREGLPLGTEKTRSIPESGKMSSHERDDRISTTREECM